jgi:pimeloyl-ACP methyl ester carboxylesterase
MLFQYQRSWLSHSRLTLGLALLALLGVEGCRCSRRPSPSATSTAVVERLAAPSPEVLSLQSKGGVALKAELWSRGAAEGPAVVLAHRLAGSRAEWAPLIPELFAQPGDLTVLALDLRGHGDSRAKDATGRLASWRELTAVDYEAMGDDVTAALTHLTQLHPARPVVLVGSDLGATVVCRAAGRLGNNLRGIALVSPGGALRGLDLFTPYAQVRTHRSWFAVGQGDAVSLAATRTLQRMATSGEVVLLESPAHGAEALGAAKPELWSKLAVFIRDAAAKSGG